MEIDAPPLITAVTIYFTLLPFFVYLFIRVAKKGNFKLHKKLQTMIFFLSLVVTVVFEFAVRTDDNFHIYLRDILSSSKFIASFLYIHILVASVTLLLWIYIVIKSHISIKGDDLFFQAKHQVLGKVIFVGLSISSLMGAVLYYLLFML